MYVPPRTPTFSLFISPFLFHFHDTIWNIFAIFSRQASSLVSVYILGYMYNHKKYSSKWVRRFFWASCAARCEGYKKYTNVDSWAKNAFSLPSLCHTLCVWGFLWVVKLLFHHIPHANGNSSERVEYMNFYFIFSSPQSLFLFFFVAKWRHSCLCFLCFVTHQWALLCGWDDDDNDDGGDVG